MTVVPGALMEAFWAYEKALANNDLSAMDQLFDDSATTLRGDAAGLLVGIDNIRRFRLTRGSAPRRRILATHVRPAGDSHALVVAVTELDDGGRGQQTQLWRRRPDDSWVVVAAHVSTAAPALDSRIWRVAGDPLAAPISPGPLDGHLVAVKDIYAVQGFTIGAGNPHRAAAGPVEQAHALAVSRLLGAGAAVRGIARTDEYAYSLAGTNTHYGTPPNPRAPGRVSGGSSSGSATAVALGHASVGLGSDTGGSIRVPAAYQGLFGIRTTHQAVSTDGMLPLAPRFDTVGWLTRSPHTLREVGRVLLPQPGTASPRRKAVVVSDFMVLAHDAVRRAIEGFVGRWGDVTVERWPAANPHAWRQVFITAQAAQAWAANGGWLATRMDTLGHDVRARFDYAAQLSAEDASAAHRAADAVGAVICELVGDRFIVMPAAPTVAPMLGTDPGEVRDATLSLTCVASLAGLPAVCLPLATTDGLPCAAAVVGPPGSDVELLDLAVTLTDGQLL